MDPKPVKKKIRKKDRRPQRFREQTTTLTQQVQALSLDVQDLQSEHNTLQLRNEIVLSAVIAADLCVRMMKRTSSGDIRAEGILQGVEQVEEKLRSLLQHDSPQVLLEPLVRWIPEHQSQVPSEELLKRFMNRTRLSGPSHSCLLDGSLCSFLYAVCIILAFDHSVKENTKQLVDAGPEAWRQWIADTRQDIQQLLLSCPADSSNPHHGPVLAAITSLLVHFYSVWLVGPLCHPKFVAETIVSHPEMSIRRPLSFALLDQVIDDMAISGQQMSSIHEISQVYEELMVPLSRQKSAIAARMSQLLAGRQDDQREVQQLLARGSPADPVEAAAAARMSQLLAGRQDDQQAVQQLLARGSPADPVQAAAAARMSQLLANRQDDQQAVQQPLARGSPADPVEAAAAAHMLQLLANRQGEQLAVQQLLAGPGAFTCGHGSSADSAAAAAGVGPAETEAGRAAAAADHSSSSSTGSVLGEYVCQSAGQGEATAQAAAVAAAAAAFSGQGSSTAQQQQSAAGGAPGPLLKDGVYHELLSLAAKLPGLEAQCHFMDLCCGHVLAGVLTWSQLAHFFVSMQPQQPALVYLTRRLSVTAAQHYMSPWLGHVPLVAMPAAKWSPPPPPPPTAPAAVAEVIEMAGPQWLGGGVTAQVEDG